MKTTSYLNMASSSMSPRCILVTNPKLPKVPYLHITPSSSILPSPRQSFQPLKFKNHNSKRLSSCTPKVASSSSSTPTPSRRTRIPRTNNTEEIEEEQIFFDGGAHYGDLVANLIFGFSLLWMPLTVAAVFRALFLRYRFTNVRVTVISGLSGSDRRDFSYSVIEDVQVVPRLFGEWGDIVITLTDGTKVDLRSVPKFREIAKYCLSKAGKKGNKSVEEAAANANIF
ncbi:hypothetical protein SUGI_1078390 [Cryptomeria japonica]|uniref:uncharacterized protein LOC131029299 n=1 Tax=Cryptomeria japonica TaxID=3369 RepID=UPI0024149396|nr:uncharacterized protein LOC131029299 [Cryptomeria japonica]GLJ50620.1 hypothetical protein SUGI_1078390 [Cryptomeria japonica]